MTPAERLRKHQRALEKTQRELDRERVKLENQEKKLVGDIKKSAKNGQMGACKIQAKDLVRTRRYVCLLSACLRFMGIYAASSMERTWRLTMDGWVSTYGKQIYTEILRHANATASNLPADTDRAIERADDAVDEGRDVLAGKYESTDESARAAADSDGV